MNASKRLGLLRVAKQRLGLDEDSYRAMLRDYGGADSARDIVDDDRAFDRVMARLRQFGFESNQYQKGYRRDTLSGWASAAQLNLIRDMWSRLMPDADEAALNSWLASHFKVSNMRFLDGERARKVIAGLKAWEARRHAKVGSSDDRGAATPLSPS